MMTALLLAVSMTATAATPDLVSRSEDGSEVRQHSRPCAYARVLANIPEPARIHFHHGVSVVDGLEFPVCWNKAGQSIYIIDDEGDVLRGSANEFKPDPGP